MALDTGQAILYNNPSIALGRDYAGIWVKAPRMPADGLGGLATPALQSLDIRSHSLLLGIRKAVQGDRRVVRGWWLTGALQEPRIRDFEGIAELRKLIRIWPLVVSQFAEDKIPSRR